MKIGILTFHYAHNYGAMLQAYALKTYLKTLGHEVRIINYVPDYMRVKYFHISKLAMVSLLKRSVIKAYFKRKANIDKFNDFETKYLGIENDRIIKKNDLPAESGKYDYIVFGSDQIWNTNITFGDMSYFCDFTTQAKAISYAASCGDALGNKEFENAVNSYVAKFRPISVRERDACLYLSSKFKLDVTQVLDPVLLIDPCKWEKLNLKSTCKIKENYVFYYSIQDNAELRMECEQYANGNGLKLVTAHGEMRTYMDRQCLLNGIGPIEFLYLIKNAKCVFTNSFHAVAFSLIFNKNAYIRTHSKTGNRVVDLLSECGVEWNGEGLFSLSNENYIRNLKVGIKGAKKFLERSLS